MQIKWLVGIAVASVLISHGAWAQDADDAHEPTLIELGASGEWGLNDGESSYGPTFSVQAMPFGDWLEIEAGTSPLFRRGHTEWQTDLAFQIPLDLSPSLEFDIGAGPEWTRSVSRHGIRDSVAAEFSLDAVYWPTTERTVGIFLEPSFEYDFGAEHDQSLNVSLGLAFPI